MHTKAIFAIVMMSFLVAFLIAVGFVFPLDHESTPPASPLPQAMTQPPVKPTLSPAVSAAIVLVSTPTATAKSEIVIREVIPPTRIPWTKKVESGWTLKLVQSMTPAENHYKLDPDGRKLTAIRGITDFTLDGKIIFTIDFPRRTIEVLDSPDCVNPEILFDSKEQPTRAYWKSRTTGQQFNVILDQVSGVTVLIN